ncbi:MAG TPA: hypothetical protein VMM17_08085 [Gemmatimonadaceae bacterium]|nr:hypothetical protein [Gemmatimonadaceae bacterium]
MKYQQRRFTAAASGVALLLVAGSCQLFQRVPSDPGRTVDTPRTARAPGSITSSAELFREIRGRYGGRWYSTLSFTGENTRWSTTGRATTNRWAEYVSVPGKLRIEFLPWSTRSGVLFTGGQVHTFDNGRRIDTRSQAHPLLILTADIYALPPEAGLAALRNLGVATQRFRETTWRGRRVYIVGGERGDTTSTQAWFDAERLIPVRWIQQETRDGRASVGDTRLASYRRVGGYLIPHDITGFRDGERVLREVYRDVRVNPTLSPQLFDPERWSIAPRPGGRR